MMRSTVDFLRRRKFAVGVVLLIAGFLVWNPFFEFHYIAGSSMWPVLRGDGEVILVSKSRGKIERGDLVVIRPEDGSKKTYLKRVAGLGGETIMIENGDVTVSRSERRTDQATPVPRSIRDMAAQRVPVFDLAGLSTKNISAVASLVDANGRPWIHADKGSMSLSDDARFLKLGDEKPGQTVVRMPADSLHDDHLDGAGKSIVQGAHLVADIWATFELEDVSPEAELTIEQIVDGHVAAAFRFEIAPTSIRILCNGADAGVIRRHEKERCGAYRLAMIDRTFVVETAPTAADDSKWTTAYQTARPAVRPTTESYLRWTVQRGWIVCARLELNRDIFYTSSRSEARFGVREPAVVLSGNVFLLGDNSAESDDSRKWGDLSETRIVGRPLFVVWPLTRMRRLERDD